jgi:hypothetical protein
MGILSIIGIGHEIPGPKSMDRMTGGFALVRIKGDGPLGVSGSLRRI